MAILGYDLWRGTYGGDPGVVGSTIRLDSEPYTVLGVAFNEWILAGSERSLNMLGAAALLVLLIALVNVANLVLVRTEARQREIAVRMAMGAGRGRLVPYFLSEGILLSLAGGAVGAVLAWWGVKGLVALYGAGLPRSAHVSLNAPALAVGLVLSLACGLLVGMVPAWRTDSENLQGELREGGRGVSRGATRIRSGLVILEFAMAVVLVSGAGLLVNSFWRLNQVDLGLKAPEQVLTFGVSLPSVNYGADASRILFVQDVTAGLRRLGGVQSVGVTNRLPLYGGYNITNLTAEGETEPVAHFVELRYVTDGFFDAVGVPLLEGRSFGPSDYADSIPGVLITQELAREIFPAGDAVGRNVDVKVVERGRPGGAGRRG